MPRKYWPFSNNILLIALDVWRLPDSLDGCYNSINICEVSEQVPQIMSDPYLFQALAASGYSRISAQQHLGHFSHSIPNERATPTISRSESSSSPTCCSKPDKGLLAIQTFPDYEKDHMRNITFLEHVKYLPQPLPVPLHQLLVSSRVLKPSWTLDIAMTKHGVQADRLWVLRPFSLSCAVGATLGQNRKAVKLFGLGRTS